MIILERVARAICAAGDADPDDTYGSLRTPSWTLYIPEARAALEAMREPSPALVSAYLAANTEYWRRMDVGPTPVGKWCNGTPAEATTYSIQAMIDAALKESP